MRLEDLVAPPARPPERVDWPAVERALGRRLPADYVRLASVYGSGEFAQHLGLLHPGVPVDTKDLVLAQPWLRSTLELVLPPASPGGEEQDLTPDWLRRRRGRLLGCINARNAESVLWETDDDDPDRWTLLVVDRDLENHAEHAMGLEAFLIALLSGELICPVLPDHLAEDPRFVPYPWAFGLGAEG